MDKWEEALYTKAELTFGFAGKCLCAKGCEVRPARIPEEWDQLQEKSSLVEAGMVIVLSKYTEKLYSLRGQDLEQHGRFWHGYRYPAAIHEKIENFTAARDSDDCCRPWP